MDDCCSPPTPNGGPAGGRPREIFAWAMYDWANSAYSTLSITIVVYYLQEIVLPGKWGKVAWTWGISFSMFAVVLLSPTLGAVADANRSKRKWLAATAMSGAGAAVLLSLVPPGNVWLVIALFVTACLMFDLSLGFYNGFLPEIADEKSMNRVSAWGYALGYLGGGLALVLALLVTKFGETLGLPDLSSRLRAGILIMGLWWGLFTVPTLWVLRDRGQPPKRRQPIHRAAAQALGEVRRTLASVRVYGALSLFLLGFLLYNDGIQSVINLSTTFAKDVLRFQIGELFALILMIQFVALPGAILVGFLSDRLGQKRILIGCLAIWVAVVGAAWFVSQENKLHFWIMGVVLALVLGGTQSVSRAIMGLMTPVQHTAEFFGFFNLSGKAASFLGLFLCGGVIAVTGSVQGAIVALLPFFLLGWAIVSRVNVQEGRRQAHRA